MTLEVNNLIGFGAGGSQNYLPLSSSATWNSGDKGANVLLTNGNLTAAWSTYSGSQCRGTVGKNSGRWYWEVTINSLGSSGVTGTYPSIGVAVLPLPTADPLLYNSAGVVRINQGGTINNVTEGGTLGFAFDASGATGILYVYFNNSLLATKTGLDLGSTWYPAFSEDNIGGNGQFTANFGASAFTYTPAFVG